MATAKDNKALPAPDKWVRRVGSTVSGKRARNLEQLKAMVREQCLGEFEAHWGEPFDWGLGATIERFWKSDCGYKRDEDEARVEYKKVRRRLQRVARSVDKFVQRREQGRDEIPRPVSLEKLVGGLEDETVERRAAAAASILLGCILQELAASDQQSRKRLRQHEARMCANVESKLATIARDAREYAEGPLAMTLSARVLAEIGRFPHCLSDAEADRQQTEAEAGEMLARVEQRWLSIREQPDRNPEPLLLSIDDLRRIVAFQVGRYGRLRALGRFAGSFPGPSNIKEWAAARGFSEREGRPAFLHRALSEAQRLQRHPSHRALAIASLLCGAGPNSWVPYERTIGNRLRVTVAQVIEDEETRVRLFFSAAGPNPIGPAPPLG